MCGSRAMHHESVIIDRDNITVQEMMKQVVHTLYTFSSRIVKNITGFIPCRTCHE
jgi:hypothetical protein